MIKERCAPAGRGEPSRRSNTMSNFLTPDQTSQKSVSLDLLRVAAAGIVLYLHVGQAAGLGFVTLVSDGAVQLFFVLSGYLSEVSLARDSSALCYYRRRAVRILPAYWLVLALRFAADTLRGVPTGAEFFRYFVFLQMFLPSENWYLWNNRGALWTMSAFALFYLLAPWLHRVLNSFRRSLPVLLVLMACKGQLGAAIENALQGWPEAANISEFSARTPLMVLPCFLFGTTLWHALRENKAFGYGAFCLLLAAALGFTKGAFECVYTALVLLAAVCPAPALSARCERGLAFLSGGSFWLYLFHPLILDLFPVPVWESAAARLVCAAGYGAVCVAVCYGVYAAVVRPLERWCRNRFSA